MTERSNGTHQPVHVLLLTPGFPGDDEETDCIPALQNLVKVLHSPHENIRITIVALQYPFQKRIYQWRGIPAASLGGKNRGHPIRWMVWQQAKRLVLQIHQRDPFNVIHVMWLTECALVAQSLGRKLKIPLLATLMGQDARKNNPYINKIDFQRFFITANSPYVAEIFQQTTGYSADKIIPLGIDEDNPAFSQTGKKRSIDILGVGAFIELKNYTAFLKIVADLFKNRPELRCLLIGDGVERPLLENLIGKLDLSENVELAGHLPREEVLRKMQQAKILLHTSQYEAQGFVLLEALACGMQVVCRPVGLYQIKEGVYAEIDNVAMTNRVNSLLGEAWKPQARFPFLRQESAHKFHQLYRNIAAKNDLG